MIQYDKNKTQQNVEPVKSLKGNSLFNKLLDHIQNRLHVSPTNSSVILRTFIILTKNEVPKNKSQKNWERT